MADDEMVPVLVRRLSKGDHLAWAEGKHFSVPRAVLQRSGLINHLDQDGNLDLPAEIAGVTPEDARLVLLRAAYTEHPPASSRGPVSYQNIPPRLRSALASVIGRMNRGSVQRWASFPGWPLDLSADFIADLGGTCPHRPPGAPAPVLLTHDLDSAEGLANLVKWFLPIEEAVGARSSNYIVPCAWPIDHALLAEVASRGHEVGIHGYDHRNRTPFSEPAERQARLAGAGDLIERYSIAGYRAPSLLRTRALLQDLAAFYRYDSSIPTSGGLFPVPNNGCASARPFTIEGIDGLVELPLSLPRDGSLRFLGHTPAEIVDIWIRCSEEIAHSGGVVILLTHCESRFSGNPKMLDAYRRFLDFVAACDRLVWSTPQEVLAQAMRT